MIRYAIDPASTKEDVIDFVNAEPLIEAGLDVDALPRYPEELGAMEPSQWYFLPEDEYEPIPYRPCRAARTCPRRSLASLIPCSTRRPGAKDGRYRRGANGWAPSG